MTVLLSIGEFSTMTRLSRKALRHYHEVGVLEPAVIDSVTGYRFYDTSQVRAAQLIRRFRELDMPVVEVKAVLEASDVAERDSVIAGHLRRLEGQVERTRSAIASLRGLIEGAASVEVSFRSLPAVRAAAVSGVVGIESVVEWWAGAVAELRAAGGVGVVGGVYARELFSEEEGEVMVFLPVGDVVEAGRVKVVEVPAVSVAVALHEGGSRGEDETYGALGTYVASRGIGVEGPVREYYPDGGIEICWPVAGV